MITELRNSYEPPGRGPGHGALRRLLCPVVRPGPCLDLVAPRCGCDRAGNPAAHARGVTTSSHKIVQARRKFNALPGERELAILERWAAAGGPKLSQWVSR